ncbi:helix-turn-helix transcriptional regulator [Nocardia carnea]|uniref:helix-turn-helix transcriptional regulator n=1 Tax=Nocardia carnea TaxID=37328 RepID=UPI002454DD22|nr:helix-turn-helix transcriptional regulator [Nocardia carnea]
MEALIDPGMRLGECIKVIREYRNLTRSELAVRAGVSRPTIICMEAGSKMSYAYTVDRVLDALQLPGNMRVLVQCHARPMWKWPALGAGEAWAGYLRRFARANQLGYRDARKILGVESHLLGAPATPVGKFIKAVRQNKSLTQRQLARRAGVAQATLSHIEATSRARPESVHKILDALEIRGELRETVNGYFCRPQSAAESTMMRAEGLCRRDSAGATES